MRELAGARSRRPAGTRVDDQTQKAEGTFV